MGYKKTLWIVLVVSVAMFVIGFIPLFPEFFGLCKNRFDFVCLRSFNRYSDVGYLTLLSPLVFVSCAALLLRIKSDEAFKAWNRFVKVYISLAGIAIFLSLRSHGGWGIPNIFATELVTMWSVILFFILSLIIIIYKVVSIRRTGKRESR